MPDVNFVGEISVAVSDLPAVSLSWAIVPGNNAWTVREGLNYGETHIAESDVHTGSASISHPIDLHLQTSATEGWPLFICELWDRTYNETKGFYGGGSVWLPAQPGRHCVECPLWRVKEKGSTGLAQYFIPMTPDIAKIRELSVSPYLRSQHECVQVGSVFLNVFVASRGFEQHGVLFVDQPVKEKSVYTTAISSGRSS